MITCILYLSAAKEGCCFSVGHGSCSVGVLITCLLHLYSRSGITEIMNFKQIFHFYLLKVNISLIIYTMDLGLCLCDHKVLV